MGRGREPELNGDGKKPGAGLGRRRGPKAAVEVGRVGLQHNNTNQHARQNIAQMRRTEMCALGGGPGG
jgi:hypothetical protein